MGKDGIYTVEICRNWHGNRDEETADFNTKEEALEWGRAMLLHYGYKVWVDGIELTRADCAK